MSFKAIVGLAATLVLSTWVGAQDYHSLRPSPVLPKSNEDFLNIEVLKSYYTNQKDPDGKPAGVIVQASVNGDALAVSCAKETNPETVPCTLLEPGTYPGVWVHDWTLLAILVDDGGHLRLRYFDVGASVIQRVARKSPSVPLTFAVPKGKQTSDYPLLIHVFGSMTERYTVWTTPEHTSCTVTGTGDDSASVDCSTRPASEIKHALNGLFATLDGDPYWGVSCTANWKGSNCLALSPGFYAARWKNDKKTQMQVLVVYRDLKAREVTFDVKQSAQSVPAEIGKPPG